jgi:uncharacterized membrane protein HdeD (DUF308 family)
MEAFLFLALGLLVGGVIILMNLHFAEVATGTLLAILLTVQGVNSVIVGAGNRPLTRGLGPLGLVSGCSRAPLLLSLAGPRAVMPRLGFGLALL